VSAAPIHLDFSYEIDGQPLLLDSLHYENSSGETFSITRLDWLATDFVPTTASGRTIARTPADRAALLAFLQTLTDPAYAPPEK
jgi:hypothetical protein